MTYLFSVEDTHKEHSEMKAKQNNHNTSVGQSEPGTLNVAMYLDTAFNNVGDPLYIKDEACKFIFVNDAFCRTFGLSRSEIIGNTLAEKVPPSEMELFLSTDSQVLKDGKEISYESTLTVDGSETKTIQTRKNRFAAPDGNHFLIGVIQDITERKQAENALHASEKSLQEIIEQLSVGVVVHDPDTSIMLANKTASTLLGLSIDQMRGKMAIDPAWKFVREDGSTLPVYDYPVARVVTTRLPVRSLVLGINRPAVGGFDRVWVIVNAFPEFESRDQLRRIVVTFADITDRKNSEEKLILSSLVMQHSSEGMLVTDENNLIIATNPAFTTITGYSFEEIQGKNPRVLSSGRHDKTFYQAMWQSLNDNGEWKGEIWDKRKNGEIHAKHISINTIRKKDSRVYRYVALFSDISEQKKTEELLWQQANFDTLTELPNRRMFRDRLTQEIMKSERANLLLALLVIDLDKFKEVNDTLGHDTGDTLLQEASRRLTDCVRETDTVARLGGDEFAVVLSQLKDTGHAEDIAQKILIRLAQPFHLGDENAFVSASIGITLYPDDAIDIESLLKNADQAMYVAKNLGRNRFSYFTAALQEAAQKRLHLTNDLRDALANKQFRVYYQPIVELATGSIHKAEALIRWQHPKRGLVSPVEFISLAEETGMIADIGNWVFHEAARQVQQWRKSIRSTLQISVNRSPVEFLSQVNLSSLPCIDYLNDLNVPGQSIVFEITEGLLLDGHSGIADTLLRFRDAGIQVAIDDFGTGYSALSYLKKFDIDYLKIDKSFVDQLATERSDAALCEAIIVMAHKLGLKVIAEGIETEQQRVIPPEISGD